MVMLVLSELCGPDQDSLSLGAIGGW
jgi:hypothetical protein